jgi:hypothetical protein
MGKLEFGLLLQRNGAKRFRKLPSRHNRKKDGEHGRSLAERACWDFQDINIGKGFVTLASCIDQALLRGGETTITKHPTRIRQDDL